MKSKRKTPSSDPLFDQLTILLDQLDKDPPAKRRKGPGRPTKHQAHTTPVIVHLYTSQVKWLDQYSDMIASMRPDNAHLSRAEIIRGLLLGLGRYAISVNLPLPDDRPIQAERDLQHALARSLGAQPKR